MVQREILGIRTILRAAQAAGQQQLLQAALYLLAEQVMAVVPSGSQHPLPVCSALSPRGEERR